MKSIILLISVSIIFGCSKSTPELEKERASLIKEIDDLKIDKKFAKKDLQVVELRLNSLEDKVQKYEAIVDSKGNPIYMVTLESRMNRPINISLKDHLNKFKFSLPVDKEFYNSIRVGDTLNKASMFMSFNNVTIKVKKKWLKRR